MSNQHRKRFLVLCTSVIGLISVAGVFVFLSNGLSPSAEKFAVYDFDLTEVEEDYHYLFKWNGFPAYFYKPSLKTKQYLIGLNSIANGPDFDLNNFPPFFIYIPLSTQRGCILQKDPEQYQVKGFWDPCDGGFWDYAGRLIPSLHDGEGLDDLRKIDDIVFLSDTTIRIVEE